MLSLVENNEILLRVWDLKDAKEAFEFYGDSQVSKYIGNGQPAQDVDQVERSLKSFIVHQSEHGFSPWAIVEKSTNKVIGICGLHVFNEKKEPELGFRISRSKWGLGIATASSRLVIEYGFNQLELSFIVALTYSENYTTQRVLEKLGFSKVNEIWSPDFRKTVLRYELHRKSYKR